MILHHVLISTLLLTVLLNTQVIAQRNCGTVEYMNQLSNSESKKTLENWILKKQLENPTIGLKSFNQGGVTIYQIPVVVHVVHNGEAIGVGSNISTAQILSQIEVLNEDFRKLNADSVNIPPVFKPLYSDIGFEFVMAKRDPSNQATNGITRIQGSQTSWNIDSSSDTELKSHDYWPSEDYLNVWVAPLCCGWLGWAQFPQSDVLTGLDPPYNATTDGVVIIYDAFGSIEKDPSANLQSNFNLGRTATHEIGHFFGLRHIWGDGGCGVDDYVADTPIAENNYAGCPIMGASTTSCSSQDMYMNFMDYVYDECMNIFSTGQKDRMLIIMENSPRRLSLTNSLGLYPPNNEDLALTHFTTPALGICNNEVTPTINVKNFGVTLISQASISLYLNETLVTTQNFGLNLGINQSVELPFSTILLSQYGNLTFKAVINTVNGSTDSFQDNDTLRITSLRAESVSELSEDFTTNNLQWTVRSTENLSALNNENAIFYTINNDAAVFNYYNIETSSDAYISPKLLLGTNAQTLIFDFSYSYRNLEDELSVNISTDCGSTFNNLLFNAKGQQLATSESVPVAFYPSSGQDWKHIQINLSEYINQEVIFSFTGISAGGNRILFDNIKVIDNTYNDIALVGLTSPATNCTELNELIIWIENKGVNSLADLFIETTQGSTTSTISYLQLNLLPGERVSLTLPISAFEGTSEISVSLPNDNNLTNNNFSQTIISPSSTNQIPLREQFESESLTNNWYLPFHSSTPNAGWKLLNNQLELIAENSPIKGLSNLIVLPPLNMLHLSSASMHVNFAYAYDGFNEELLKIKATTDCGETYETLFIEGGEDLATSFTTTPWWPNGSTDWKNIYVNLTSFAGFENVQLVIELISAKGNNAFINSFELYASNIIDPLNLVSNSITAYPNPSSTGTINISFNLKEPQQAKLLIYNTQGRLIYEKHVENALNQTFKIETIHLQSGMYFARLAGSKIDISKSFIINQ